ncbi:hypothetical protein BA6E_105119 [Bacteroidales bacterium 6E]|nr:hypothetical protein BA6E_105119 [Bacteroidales bacterium 6E]
MFASEQEMSKIFEKFLKERFGNSYLKECQGLFGIPDFVVYSWEKDETAVISFELKLSDWKRAAKQAFRYRSFSNMSYVVMSAQKSAVAVKNIDLFKRYNIGLAKFNNDGFFEILHKPEISQPYSENLNRKLMQSIGNSHLKAKNVEVLL